MSTKPLLGVLVVAGLMSGCASTPRDAAFPDVERTVTERTGKQVHWNQGTDQDQAAAQAVRDLLSKELTVDAAVQIALLNNQNLQAVYEDLGVAQAELVGAGLLKNPVFDGKINFFSAGPTLELSVVQNFIDLFYIPMRKRLASTALEEAKLRVAGTIIEMAGRVRSAAYQVQATEQLREMREMIMHGAEASYDLAKRIRAAGNNTALDLAREQVMYEQAKLDLASAESDVMEAREHVMVLMGLWGTDTTWTITARLPDLPKDEPSGEGLEKRAIAQSLDLAAIRQKISLMSQRLGLATPLIPEAGIGINGQRESGGSWGWGPELSVQIPLFDQGQAVSGVARAELMRSWDQYTAVAVEVRSAVRIAQHRVVAARKRANYLKLVILPLRQKIIDEMQLNYNAMLSGTFELLTSKAQEIEAGQQYVMALRDYWLARTQLDGLLQGRLDSKDNSAPSAPNAAGSRTNDQGGY